MLIKPYDRHKARAEIIEMFRPLLADASIAVNAQRHLTILRNMSATLPTTLKPTKAQLSTPHYHGVDMLASASLRDTLIGLGTEVAENFVTSISGNELGSTDMGGQLIIWGQDPFDEMAWEFSSDILTRWNWLLGTTWVNRANFWRRQRGAQLLPERTTEWYEHE